MKKKFMLLLGVLCSICFYACQKSINELKPAVSDENVLSESAADQIGFSAAMRGNHPPVNLTNGPLQPIDYDLGAGAFTEGPAVDKNGNVFFTDQPHDKIYKWDANTGNVKLFLTGTGRSNGMGFDEDGNLISCADMHGEIWKIRPNGKHTVIAKDYHGKLLNGPNDIWINHKTGGMYITDPIFPRDYWDASDPRKQPWEPTHSEQAATGKGGHVYYLAPGCRELVRVTTMEGWNADSWPNGVVGTPDGKKLYVNQWSYNGTGGIWVFDIKHDGTLSKIKPFVTGLDFCDGMSMDEYGNVYVSTNLGVKVYNPKGENIETIAVTGGAANNVFAGRNEKTFFMTGGGSGKLFTQKMNVKGVEKFDNDHNHWNGH